MWIKARVLRCQQVRILNVTRIFGGHRTARTRHFDFDASAVRLVEEKEKNLLLRIYIITDAAFDVASAYALVGFWQDRHPLNAATCVD